MVLNIDIDGVIFPFDKVIKKFAEKYLDCKLPAITQWDIWKDWNITEEKFYEIFSQLSTDTRDTTLEETQPVVGAVKYLRMLKDNHTINLVTSRGTEYSNKMGEETMFGIRMKTIEWIFNYSIPHHNLMFVRNKNMVKADYVLDDGVHNFSKKSTAVQVCFDRPWNSGWEGLRVYNWEEFYNLVNNRAG